MNSARDNDTALVKEELKRRIEGLCSKLLPDGRRQGRLWVAHNPVTGDYSQSPEFKVPLNRDVGAWVDWRTGEKGDVIRLIEYVNRCDFKEALDWARDFLGMRNMSPAQRRELADRAKAERKRADDTAEQRRLKRMADAEKIWMGGYQDGSASTAETHARRYFATRHCPLEGIDNRDLATFRFSAGQEFWPRAQFRHENGRRIKVQAGPRFPAVLSAMRLPTGQVAAVHMTFLSPLGPQKLPVSKNENAKIMFGEARGAMIRISHGPEGEPPETATRPHPLILCEGIEDGLSLARACPEARVWAAGSLSAMGSAPIDLPCISAVVISRDNDWEKATAIKQFDQVWEALSKAGKPMTIIESHVGKDFNDLIQEE
ncbi:toprim domain-containing protein [Sinorhizobium sp. BJ1]|uniref:toprim domain-containing protein n=1 Tax=Sinorhizobium sp. BJ1 TaxID=2035455 RepID=UPI000BE9EDA9|nr:toprim domain-containing protein [Sinorhizobium sp. BJ1]PDT80598.1 hypothetical protein CO676_26725 [Sinorhizobium sp. BJ1]